PQVGVAGDLLQPMQGHACVGESGEPGVPQVVPAQMLESQLRHHIIPVRRIPQNAGSDPAAAWTDEQRRVHECLTQPAFAGLRVGSADSVTGVVDVGQHQWPNMADDRDASRPLPFRTFVFETAEPRGCPAAQGPHPLGGVDAADPATGNLAGGARFAPMADICVSGATPGPCSLSNPA
ncbi:hypothetical protein ACFROC_25535, partial [Nocardia tengchongensis]|uniref:hypothetical protein n=1 Tax=Nocardia tengchongensis TaxID=2055889 RepID=UPI0036C348AE